MKSANSSEVTIDKGTFGRTLRWRPADWTGLASLNRGSLVVCSVNLIMTASIHMQLMQVVKLSCNLISCRQPEA